MSNIAELSVQINADTGNFSSGMTSAADSVQSFGAQTISVTRSVSKSFLNMTKIVSGFSVGASAALVAVVTSQSAIALANVRMADSWGIPIKSMYEFQAAAKSVGVDADEMANILKDVGEKLGEYFMTGGGGAADAFEQLNLQVKDFIDLDASEAFLKIGESMQHLDIKEQIFLIESLASESSKLLPIFENNAEGYKKAIEEATASGNILTANQATAAAEFAKSTTKIGSMISGLSKQLTVQLSRPFALMIEWINKVIKEAGGVEQVAKNIAKSFINGIASIIKSGGELLSYFDNVELKMLKIELAWAKTKKAMSFSWLDSNEVIMSVNADVTDAENKIEALKKDIEKRVDISVSADNMADDLIGKLGTSGMPEPEQFSTSGNR
ncbi:MAG: hypothetical protein KAI17_27530, partial [Thiotrichaceae bacterium]|nr:hypothetical protein [Thiotrichaceae bacterium]